MHEGYVYHDRKMMKWMPFNALLEQGNHVSDLLLKHTYKEMPILSVDQLEELNFKLEEAVVFKQTIEVTYYENNHFHSISGMIERIDVFNKLIFIGSTGIPAQTIIEIKTV
jgi:hypothetical protein